MKDLKEIISNHPQEHIELFKKLRKEQNPHTLFITCSDSRIIPNIITSTMPGDLFLIRNVGNIVPNPDSSAISVLAAVEYAVNILRISDIVICGHSNCGAIGAVCNPASYDKAKNSSLDEWLKHVKITHKELVHDAVTSKLDFASQANVLQQIKNLSEHKFISEKIKSHQLELHAWWFDIGVTTVKYFSIESQRFIDYV